MELKSKPLEIGDSSGELPWEACLHAVLAGSQISGLAPATTKAVDENGDGCALVFGC